MIRRISNKNDYIDIVRSCPSGVIDDIYEVEYYVDGYSNVYSASFSKKGSLLEVIIPSSALQTLPSGLLMRRAKYRNEDPSFPDGNYDLEFVEDINVWLESGSGEPGPGPEPGEYLTADDLKTINNQSLVGEGNIQIDPGVPAQTFTDHVIGNIQDFSALDNRVTALEQGGGGGGVSQEQFDAHVAQNGAQFSGIDQSLSNLSQGVQQAQASADSAASQAAQAHQRALQAIRKNEDQDAMMVAIEAKNAEQDDRLTALEQSPGGVSQAQFDAHVVANNESFNFLQGATQDNTQRIDALENAGFATQQDLDAVGATILAVRDSVDGIDQRVTDLEGQNNVQYNTDNPLYDGYNKVITTFEPGNGNTPLFILVNNENSSDVQYDGIKIDSSGIFKYSANNYEDPGSWTEYSDELATQDWVQNQGYATQQWVTGRGYLTSSSTLPADQITCNISGDVFDFDDVDEGLTALVSKVEEQIDDITSLDTRVTDLENAGYATQTWVGQQGYITSSALSGYATQTWVQNQDYASDSDLDALDARVSVLEHGGSPVTLAWGGISGTITDQTDLVSYIGNQGFLTSSDLSGYATQSWVGQQGYITSSALSGYATESWVGQQGYITSSALSGYATESWATNQFLEESKVWTGTETQWNQLSAAQKASYTIALITQ